MSRVKFYWESRGEHYQFDSRKKYLIYYRGCFGPPHRGHFNTIADFVYLENANFFIHQGGNSRRHGVPYDLSRKIWKIYIKELLPKDKFFLMGRGSHEESDMVEHPYVKEAETIVFIAGNENYVPKDKELEDITIKYREIFNKLLRRKKEIVFLYLDRPQQSILSATKLCQSIRNGDDIISRRDQKNIENLRNYFPEGLPDSAVRYIVRKLRYCDLH